jgi:ParB family chromosome partitioning protein
MKTKSKSKNSQSSHPRNSDTKELEKNVEGEGKTVFSGPGIKKMEKRIEYEERKKATKEGRLLIPISHERLQEIDPDYKREAKKVKISVNNESLGLSEAENIDEKIYGRPEVAYYKMSDIIEPEVAMRDEVDRNKLRSLSESIKKIGLINPITITKSGEKFEIIAGVRRYIAHKMLMREKILCYVLSSDSVEIVQRRYAENMERTEIEPWEEGRYLMHLQTKYNLTQQEVAHSIGKSVGYVNERITVVSYNLDVLKALKEGLIEFSVARELNKVESEVKMLEMLNYAIKGGCNARTMRQWREDINIDLQTVAKRGEEIAHASGEGYQKPEELYITCNICQKRVLLQKTTVMRICMDCFDKDFK